MTTRAELERECRERAEPFCCCVQPRLLGIPKHHPDCPAPKVYAALLKMAKDTRRAYAERSGPRIVCLCGSTRFMDAFFDEGWKETLKGNIVLSVGVWRKGPADHAGEWIGEEVKQQLDELHKRKIDLADEVLVLNVGGYIGASTQSELEYAEAHGKPVRYLEAAAIERLVGK